MWLDFRNVHHLPLQTYKSGEISARIAVKVLPPLSLVEHVATGLDTLFHLASKTSKRCPEKGNLSRGGSASDLLSVIIVKSTNRRRNRFLIGLSLETQPCRHSAASVRNIVCMFVCRLEEKGPVKVDRREKEREERISDRGEAAQVFVGPHAGELRKKPSDFNHTVAASGRRTVCFIYNLWRPQLPALYIEMEVLTPNVFQCIK